jgi:hypothetical protein
MKRILSNKNTIMMLCIILTIAFALVYMFTYRDYCEGRGGTYINVNGKPGCIYGSKN